jgi:hypothetical protein
MTAIWSASYPGAITLVCGSRVRVDVHHETGRMLRIGGEIRLCFDCNPEGGHYHPDQADMATVGEKAATFDRAFNQFERHSHALISGERILGQRVEHSHTDGSEPHAHPEHGPAAFTWTKEEARRVGFLPSSGTAPKLSRKPTGPQLEYVATPDDELYFPVVWCLGSELSDTGPTGMATNEQEREEFARSRAAFAEATTKPGSWLVGPGAVTLTANRMRLRFRLIPVYRFCTEHGEATAA